MTESPSAGRTPDELFDAARDLFDELCDLPEPERAPRLAVAEPELRAVVEELLSIDSRTRAGLDQPPLGELGADEGIALPESVAGYRVLELLGVGGAGVVYKARQARPDRLVALKLIRGAAVSAEQLRRFEHEAQVLAWLDHPGIARVYEAGTAEGGGGVREPYFAMELIDGLPITRACVERGMDTRARLALLAKVCDAVHHAHQKGVIHRDLKPGNVLVDARGEPKVLDFGVARVTGSDLELSTLHTHTGQILGTLPYMSPEQLAADPSALDIRSDVYSLGVLAYHVLSGGLPIDVAGTRLAEAARRITEDEPTSLGVLDRSLRGDVETIVGKAIAKEKERRYASAEELALDIRRHLADEPITARPPTTLYQVVRFARRNRVLVGGLVAVLLTLVAGTVVSTVLYFDKEAERLDADEARAAAVAAGDQERVAREAAQAAALQEREARREAEDEADLREAMFDQLVQMLSAPTPWTRGADVKMIDVLDAAARESGSTFADRPLVRAEFLRTFAQTYMRLALVDRARPFAEESFELFLEHAPESVERALAEAFLGEIVFERGDLAGLESMRAALSQLEELGAPASELANANLRLSYKLLAAGQLGEAEGLALRSIEICEEASNETTELELAGAGVALADVLAQAGRYREAAERLEEVVRVLREQAPGTMALSQALNSLSACLLQERRMEAALPVLEESADLMRELGGDEYIDYGVKLGNIATLHAMSWRFDEAIRYYEEGLAVSRRLFEGEGPNEDEGILLGNLARCYHSLGRLEEALDTSREGARILELALGERSIQRAHVVATMARALIDLGRYEEGAEQLDEAIEILEQFLGPDHPDLPDLCMWRGRVFLALGEPGAAAESFRHAREVQRRSQRPDPVLEVLTLAGEAAGLVLDGALEDGQALAEEAAAQGPPVVSEDHWSRLVAAGVQGLCRAAAAEPDSEAERAGWREYEAALEALRARDDPVTRAPNAERLERLGASFRAEFGS